MNMCGTFIVPRRLTVQCVSVHMRSGAGKSWSNRDRIMGIEQEAAVLKIGASRV